MRIHPSESSPSEASCFELRYQYAVITDQMRNGSVVELRMIGTQMTGLEG